MLYFDICISLGLALCGLGWYLPTVGVCCCVGWLCSCLLVFGLFVLLVGCGVVAFCWGVVFGCACVGCLRLVV